MKVRVKESVFESVLCTHLHHEDVTARIRIRYSPLMQTYQMEQIVSTLPFFRMHCIKEDKNGHLFMTRPGDSGKPIPIIYSFQLSTKQQAK